MAGTKEPVVIHPSAIVDTGATIGPGTRIWHFVHICAEAIIGAGCSFGQNVFIGNRVKIGNNVRIQNNVSVYDDVELEDDVFCGPSMVFTNVINPRAHVSRKDEYRKTLVKRGASIGANATIVCGATLGEYSFVGAGAVVTRDVPNYALVTGVPAILAGWVCECGVKLPVQINAATDPESNSATDSVQCASCAKSYRIEGNACQPLV